MPFPFGSARADVTPASVTALPYSGVTVDKSEYVEGVLKWLWFTGMIFAVAFFLPAAEGRMSGRQRNMQLMGWQMAQVAHMAAYYIPQYPDAAERRVSPMPVVLAWTVAFAGVSANWLTIIAGGVALGGAKRLDAQKWARAGCRLALLAGLLALASSLVWFQYVGIKPIWGAWLWVVSPMFLAYGLRRCAKRHILQGAESHEVG